MTTLPQSLGGTLRLFEIHLSMNCPICIALGNQCLNLTLDSGIHCDLATAAIILEQTTWGGLLGPEHMNVL